MTVAETSIQDLKLIHQFRADDRRGSFVKTFHDSTLNGHGIQFQLKESFYSVSDKDVIRGMHFHHPPFDHDKIVFCTHGQIMDVALDLRKNSNSYGHYFSVELSAENHMALYIPKGFAHGFKALTSGACAFYFVSGEYHAQADDGIRFDSFGYNWQTPSPILSDRDLSFQLFEHFQSPF